MAHIAEHVDDDYDDDDPEDAPGINYNPQQRTNADDEYFTSEDIYDEDFSALTTTVLLPSKRFSNNGDDDVMTNSNTTAALAKRDATSTELKDTFIIDSGCKGAHICRDPTLLLDSTKYNTMKDNNNKARVQGITGHSLEATEVGELPNVGKTLCVPGADANLLSMMQLVEKGGYIKANRAKLQVFADNGQPLLTARNNGDGFWRCSYRELTSLPYKMYSLHADEPTITTGENQVSEEPPINTNAEITRTRKHYSAEERQRATKDAYSLCSLVGHPNDEALCQALDHGSFSHTYLTSQDLRNARALFGPCKACLEAKIRAPAERASTTSRRPPSYRSSTASTSKH
eukprot:gene11881-13412_t